MCRARSGAAEIEGGRNDEDRYGQPGLSQEFGGF